MGVKFEINMKTFGLSNDDTKYASKKERETVSKAIYKYVPLIYKREDENGQNLDKLTLEEEMDQEGIVLTKEQCEMILNIPSKARLYGYSEQELSDLYLKDEKLNRGMMQRMTKRQQEINDKKTNTLLDKTNQVTIDYYIDLQFLKKRAYDTLIEEMNKAKEETSIIESSREDELDSLNKEGEDNKNLNTQKIVNEQKNTDYNDLNQRRQGLCIQKIIPLDIMRISQEYKRKDHVTHDEINKATYKMNPNFMNEEPIITYVEDDRVYELRQEGVIGFNIKGMTPTRKNDIATDHINRYNMTILKKDGNIDDSYSFQAEDIVVPEIQKKSEDCKFLMTQVFSKQYLKRVLDNYVGIIDYQDEKCTITFRDIGKKVSNRLISKMEAQKDIAVNNEREE